MEVWEYAVLTEGAGGWSWDGPGKDAAFRTTGQTKVDNNSRTSIAAGFLNGAGTQGWEVVGHVAIDGANQRYTLKRRSPTSETRASAVAAPPQTVSSSQAATGGADTAPSSPHSFIQSLYDYRLVLPPAKNEALVIVYCAASKTGEIYLEYYKEGESYKVTVFSPIVQRHVNGQTAGVALFSGLKPKDPKFDVKGAGESATSLAFVVGGVVEVDWRPRGK